MDEPKEKRYRQVQVWIPVLEARRIRERLGLLPGPYCETEKDDKVLANCHLPERLAWLIEKKIGPNSIHALSCIYLYQFSKKEQPVKTQGAWGVRPINKLLKDFLKAFAVGKAGLHIDFEPKPEDLKKVA